jgi:3-hydroxyisobutyrate dehydrogenase
MAGREGRTDLTPFGRGRAARVVARASTLLPSVPHEGQRREVMPNLSHAEYRIGIVGVGRMGAGIARHLKDEGFSVTVVHDIRPDVARAVAAELGAMAAPSLAAVTRAAGAVITVVTDDAAMRSIYAESGHSLLQGAQGRLFINCATVTPQVHVEVERLVEAAGGQSLEACMASSIPQAREGTLYLMVGGKRQAYERALPILQAMSKDLRYVGEAGKAAQVKALVNMVMNINTAGLAEGLGLGAALGLDLAMLREVFAQTGAASRVLETDGLDMQNRDHECYFSAAHAAKDSGIALALARAAGLALPLAEATKRQYDRMVELGLGELDKSGIAELTFPGRLGSGS